MSQYIHKPLTVEAVRLPVSGDDDVSVFIDWAVKHDFVYISEKDESLVFLSYGVEVMAEAGDWIVKEFDNQFQRYSHDSFKAHFISF